MVRLVLGAVPPSLFGSTICLVVKVLFCIVSRAFVGVRMYVWWQWLLTQARLSISLTISCFGFDPCLPLSPSPCVTQQIGCPSSQTSCLAPPTAHSACGNPLTCQNLSSLPLTLCLHVWLSATACRQTSQSHTMCASMNCPDTSSALSQRERHTHIQSRHTVTQREKKRQKRTPTQRCLFMRRIARTHTTPHTATAML